MTRRRPASPAVASLRSRSSRTERQNVRFALRFRLKLGCATFRYGLLPAKRCVPTSATLRLANIQTEAGSSKSTLRRITQDSHLHSLIAHRGHEVVGEPCNFRSRKPATARRMAQQVLKGCAAMGFRNYWPPPKTCTRLVTRFQNLGFLENIRDNSKSEFHPIKSRV